MEFYNISVQKYALSDTNGQRTTDRLTKSDILDNYFINYYMTSKLEFHFSSQWVQLKKMYNTTGFLITEIIGIAPTDIFLWLITWTIFFNQISKIKIGFSFKISPIKNLSIALLIILYKYFCKNTKMFQLKN